MSRLDPSKDSADFIPGLIGSYPNYFFDVREEDLPDFFDLLAHFEQKPERSWSGWPGTGSTGRTRRFWDDL